MNLQFYSIAVISWFAAMSPGPDFLIVSKNAISRSRNHGLVSALGICSGLLFHTTYCVLGLGFIITQSPWLFGLIKWSGALYLAYLGIHGLFKSDSSLLTQPPGNNNSINNSYWQSFKEGFFVNLLNPKCSLFMLALFTVVISPKASTGIKTCYAIEVVLVSLAWFSLLSMTISAKPIFEKLSKNQALISRITSILLLTLSACFILR